METVATTSVRVILHASARTHIAALAAPVVITPLQLRPASSAVQPSQSLRIDPRAMAARRSELRA